MAQVLPDYNISELLRHSNASNYTRNEEGYYGEGDPNHHGVALASWNLVYVATPFVVSLFLILAGALKLGTEFNLHTFFTNPARFFIPGTCSSYYICNLFDCH